MASISRFPTTSTGAWDNASNGEADDSAYATARPAPSDVSNAFYRNFGFDSAIPAGASITSAVIEAQWHVSTSTDAKLRMRARINGANAGDLVEDTSNPTTDVIRTGNPGVSSRSDLLDGVFEVRISADRTGSAFTGYLDYVKATVSYTT